MNEDLFESFPHPASDVGAFVWGPYFFIVQLRSGGVVQYKPEDMTAFRAWLCNAGARDVVAAYEAAIGDEGCE